MNVNLKLSVTLSDKCTAVLDVTVFSIDDSFNASVDGTEMIANGKSLKESLNNLADVIRGPKEKTANMKMPDLQF